MAEATMTAAKLKCSNCGNEDLEQFYVDCLDREWNRYTVQLGAVSDGEAYVEPAEHLKSIEVIGEDDRVYGCSACGVEFTTAEGVLADG